VVFVLLEAALFGITIFVDLVTGLEVTVVPFYVIATAVVTWRHSFAVGILGAMISAAGWTYSEIVDGLYYTSSFAMMVNLGSRFGAFLLVAYGVTVYRQSLAAHRERLRLLEYFVCCCPSCGRLSAARDGWFSPAELFAGGRHPVRYCPECSGQGRK